MRCRCGAKKCAERGENDDAQRRCVTEIGRMGDFRQLKAWQEAKRLATLSRDLVRLLPPNEAFALGAQWRRAAYSVALNIAEGAAQSSSRQFRRYLQIAKGSLDELEGVLELAECYLSSG